MAATNALALSPGATLDAASWNLGDAWVMAQELAKTDWLPEHLRGKPGSVMAVMMQAREMGLSFWVAARGMHVIKGVPAMSADLLMALALKHPACEHIAIEESTAKVCRISAKRKGQKALLLTVTLEEVPADLRAKKVWGDHPAAMLCALGKRRAIRAVFPEASLGLYTVEEVEDMTGAPPTARPEDVIDVPFTSTPAAETAKEAAPAEAAPAPGATKAIEDWYRELDGATTLTRVEELGELARDLAFLAQAERDKAKRAWAAKRTELQAKKT